MKDIVTYKNYNLSFDSNGKEIKVAEDINISLKENEIIGIVGESGCGKTVTAMSLIGLIKQEHIKNKSGEIFYNGVDISRFTDGQLKHIRGKEIGMIYQDSLAALNPVYKIGQQIVEGILLHDKLSKKDAKNLALSMLKRVGIDDVNKVYESYASELSGGMRQRVIIAMALVLKPKVLIADEPTTALDVTIQAQIIELLKGIKEEFKMSIIIITHDFGVVAELCDRVYVMYAGMVIESGEVFEIFDNARHPYTKALLKSRPSLEVDFEGIKELDTIKGNVISLADKPKHCYFYERCEECIEKCKTEKVKLIKLDKHKVRCLKYDGVNYGK